MKLKNDELKVGQKVWICDYRHNDILKKPIRHVKPTEVIVWDNSDKPKNKIIYYSKTHFRTLKNGKPTSKIIAPCDNTGYRTVTGTFVNIFDNKEECIQCYRDQCNEIMNQIIEGQDDAVERFENMLNKVREEFIKEY